MADILVSNGWIDRQIEVYGRRSQRTPMEKHTVHPSAHAPTTLEENGVGGDRPMAVAVHGVEVRSDIGM